MPIMFYIQSCASEIHYVMDNGRSYKEKGFEYRYSVVPLENAGLEVKVFQKSESLEGFLTITRTPFSPLVTKKDSSIEIMNVSLMPRFPDGTVLERKVKYDPHFKTENAYYTCANFSEQEKKDKRLFLRIVYDVTVKGMITHKEKEYELVRKKHYRVGLH